MNLRAFFIKKASDFSPMPCYSIRLLCVLLHLHCEPRSEAEGVFEDSCFGKAYVLVPASRHHRIVVVCRLRLLGSANSLLWAVSLVQNDTQSFRTSLRGTFRRPPSARRWRSFPSPRDASPCIRVAPSSLLSCFCCPPREWCFRAITLLTNEIVWQIDFSIKGFSPF